jgi:hypothetical protein
MQTSSNGSHVILRVMKLAGAIVCVALTLFVVESHRDRFFSQRAPRAYAESQQSMASLTTTEALTATLKFAHAVYVVPENASITVDLVVEDASDLAGWEAVLVYDPAFLAPTQLTAGDFLAGSGRVQDVLGPRETVPGRLLIGSYTHGTTPTVNGNGVLAHVTFSALSAGRTLVNIDNTVLVSLADLGIVEVQPATSFGTEIVYDTPLAVALASLDATATASGVMLTWETVSEIDNQGFHVLRSASSGASATAQAFVPSLAPGSSQGARYEWLDTDVSPGSTYFYWLEDIATSGIITRHGPVRIELQTPTAVKSGDLVAGSASTSFDLWWLALLCVAATLVGGALGVWKYAKH